MREGLSEGESEEGAWCWPVDLIMLYRPHLINVNDSCSTVLLVCFVCICRSVRT